LLEFELFSFLFLPSYFSLSSLFRFFLLTQLFFRSYLFEYFINDKIWQHIFFNKRKNYNTFLSLMYLLNHLLLPTILTTFPLLFIFLFIFIFIFVPTNLPNLLRCIGLLSFLVITISRINLFLLFISIQYRISFSKFWLL